MVGRTMGPSFRSVVVAWSFSIAACKGGGGSASSPPPAQPSTGAPIAFEVTKVTPGADRAGKLAVRAYNFSAKTIAGYTIAARYTDQAGAVIKVGVGTAFEKDVAWTSFAGQGFQCKPKSWCRFDIEMIEVPAATAKAEVMLTSAKALGPDNFKFEEDDLWSSPKGMGNWPL